jgi:acetyltransferase-like isoleucine patch superfamily enzyme
MNLVSRLHIIWKNNLYKFKGILLKIYLKAHGCEVGKGLRVIAFPQFRTVPVGNIRIGNHVSLGSNIVLQVFPDGNLVLDDHCKLVHDVFILSAKSVYIGKHSGIAERCSIRDTEHGAKAGIPMYEQALHSQEVHIGHDVQISLGSAVLAGAKIADGVVIGAGSIITRNLQTVENGIYFGNPPRLISKRME